MKGKKILVKDVIGSSFADDREKGEKLRHEIERNLENGEAQLILDFSGITALTTSFNDEVFRKLNRKWRKPYYFKLEGLKSDNKAEIEKLLAPEKIELKLRTLKVSGYKNLVNFRWEDIKEFNAVFGPNSSGKSAIIEAFDLLVNAHRGNLNMLFNELNLKFMATPVHLFSDPHKNIEIEAKFDYNNSELVLNSWITWKSDQKWVSIGSLVHNSQTIYTFFQMENENISYQGSYEDWIDILDKIKVIKLQPERLKAPSPVFEVNLKEDGSNIASFLHNLKKKFPEKYRNILYGISTYVPEINDFRTEEFQIDGKLFVRLLFQDSRGWHPAAVMSDGTVRILGFLAFINHPRSDIIVIDEPENGFHPERLKWWIESLVSGARQNTIQVILMTHSPLIAQSVPRETWWITTSSNSGAYIEQVPDFVDNIEELL